ncbi:MAG: UDP-glucose 4-epimerase [Candidatus Aenigmatarchaeota archaeon]|nr:MAG: UDP-glucose 4-epimerase [Candidatus Aenigmarchaeota archaeon]
MRALVTGCAGFIGSHLVERLLEEGYHIVGIDCFTDYYSEDMKRKNMEGFKNNENFEFIEKDILNMNLMPVLEGVDYVFHLAAQPGVRASWGKNFEVYTRNNILATQRLLEACKGLEIKRFVFASSSSVYGDSKELPLKESLYPKPLSPYGVTKLAAENLCVLYYKNYGIPVVSLRYFTVYGPRQRPDMAFHKFIKAVLEEKAITIYGDGNQTRDFTYVSDAVNATVLGMKGEPGEIYNIGGGSRISVNKAIEVIEELTGKKAKIKYEPFQKGDMRDTYADISKAEKGLGYKPEIDINTGLKKQTEYVRNLRV